MTGRGRRAVAMSVAMLKEELKNLVFFFLSC